MNQFKRYIYRIAGIAVCLLLLIQLSGCNRGLVSGGEGTLSVDFGAVNDEVTVKSAGGAKANKAGLVYALDVVDLQGDTVAHYPDHRQARSIRLVEGKYTVIAEDNSPASTEPFGEPRFGGSQEVIIKAGENTPVMMACSLINVKVTVAFESDIQNHFTDYSLTIKPTLDSEDSLIFRQPEMDNGQVGWINQTRKGTFVLIFRARNQQSPDKLMEFVRTIADAQPADFYRLTFKINPEGGASDGGALFRLSVRTDLTEYEFPLGVKDQTRPIPVVVRHDGISIREPMATNVVTRDGQPRIDIRAEAGIQRLRIRHTDPSVLLKYGLPGVITLGGDNTQAEDEALRKQMMGIVTWSDKRLVGEPDAWIDFSGLVNTAMLGGELLPEGIYSVDIEVYDFDNQMITQAVSVAVMPDMDFTVYSVPKNGAWATFVDLEGQWLTLSQPAHITFEYAVDGTEDWTRVPEADVVVNGKDISAHVKGLIPATTYNYRLVGENVKTSESKTFTTDEAVQIPNLNFEYGYTIGSISSGFMGGTSKNVWSPNLPGESFWSTGNPGSTFEVLGQGLKTNVTTQAQSAEALNRQGYALRMQTYNVDVMGVTSLASGTVFSGTFGYITSAPTSPEAQTALVHYGQSYKGRPTGLKGWYKYSSQIINKDYAGKHPDMVNKNIPDSCRVYISLEDWGRETSRPGNPKIIGTGEFIGKATGTNESTNGYFPFEFRINYKDKATKPTHIVMCASSSYLSDDFCGGVGSVLYIDEFELVWE